MNAKIPTCQNIEYTQTQSQGIRSNFRSNNKINIITKIRSAFVDSTGTEFMAN